MITLENTNKKDIVCFVSKQRSHPFKIGTTIIQDSVLNSHSTKITTRNIKQGDAIEIIDYSNKRPQIDSGIRIGTKKQLGEFSLIAKHEKDYLVIPHKIDGKENIPENWIPQIFKVLSEFQSKKL